MEKQALIFPCFLYNKQIAWKQRINSSQIPN